MSYPRNIELIPQPKVLSPIIRRSTGEVFSTTERWEFLTMDEIAQQAIERWERKYDKDEEENGSEEKDCNPRG